MNNVINHLPSCAKLLLRNRIQALNFIERQKTNGYKSNCIYHVDGSISVDLVKTGEDKKTKQYFGTFKI